MFTREDYLNKKCTHDEYYSQYVTEGTIYIVENYFGRDKLIEAFAEDEHFNSIPLHRWDSLTQFVAGAFITKMKELGESNSLSALVCIIKTAARILVKRANKVE